MPLLPGLYEDFITRSIQDWIDLATEQGMVSKTRAFPKEGDATMLAQWLSPLISKTLSSLPANNRGQLQVELVNKVVRLLAEELQSHSRSRQENAVEPSDILTSGEILEQLRQSARAPEMARPTSPLTQPALLTGSHGDPSLVDEYQLELRSADRVDAIVSFVTWGGWLQVRDALTQVSERIRHARSLMGDSAPHGPIIRLMTTTYMGNSDARALQEFARIPGTEVRVSMDPRRSRLHAKAWLFERQTGLHTAYIGSANLSKAALSTGVEWTLKITQKDSPHLIDKFRKTFDSLWNDGEFEPLDPESSEAMVRLRTILQQQSGQGFSDELPTSLVLHPFPFQQAILEQLSTEREDYDRYRNLVVAATGTGKTVIAALDYRRLVRERKQPRLLFVAHREELLAQAQKTYRIALRDGAFGEKLVGGNRPEQWNHVFASIQSLNHLSLDQDFKPDHWDIVVIDEFHHAAAPGYQKLLNWIQPKYLLGLTATPERADGLDILRWFGNRIAAEIRLWDALDRQLLTPFSYFGIADGVSLEDVKWIGGDYDKNDLSIAYCQNRNRAALVIDRLREIHPNVEKATVLGFCVSIEHAHFMEEAFRESGIPSKAISGKTAEDERKSILSDLRMGRIRVVFACDLLNEGIDIPEIDTLLFLRPTASATVFQQQLGRGLRLHEGKEQTFVLDFVGRARREFRFDKPLSVMTGLHRKSLLDSFEGNRTPKMPRGCSMQLDRQAREDLLENLKENLQWDARKVRNELKAWRIRSGNPDQLSLLDFVEDTGVSLEDIWSKGIGGWTPLLRSINALPTLSDSETNAEDRWSTGLGRLLHLDDALYFDFLLDSLDNEFHDIPGNALNEQRLAMLFFQMMNKPGVEERGFQRPRLEMLWKNMHFRNDLKMIAQLKAKTAIRSKQPLSLFGTALSIHCRYQRREILSGLGIWDWMTQREWREGVLYSAEKNLDVFVVTMVKDEKRFSPTTRYEDCAISTELFHWKSQSGTSPESPTGMRYQTLGKGLNKALLFVREHQDQAYLFLGEVEYLRHEGSKPMGIDFKLKTPMPAKEFQGWASIVAA